MKQHTDLRHKAVELVVSGLVTVHSYQVDDDGAVVSAIGTVKGYDTAFHPGAVICTCAHGRHSTRSHSHDKALRLAAREQQRREQDAARY